VVTLVILTASALFVLWQVNEAKRTRHDQLVLARLDTYSRLTAKMVEIDQFLIQYPELRPFLYEGAPLPGDPRLRSQVSTLAEWFCDFMEETCVHEELVESGFVSRASADADVSMFTVWNEFFSSIYESSPAVREILSTQPEWFRVDLFTKYGIVPEATQGLRLRECTARDQILLPQVERIYRDAFPPEERVPFHQLRDSINAGSRRLVLALATDGHVVGFSITFDLEIDDGVVLEYLAVDDQHRSTGIGTELLQSVLAYEANRYKQYLLLEVESDDDVDGDERTKRIRRVAFYERNGGCVLTPSPGVKLPRLDSDGGYNRMKLMWHPLALGAFPPSGDELIAAVGALLEKSYGCSPSEAAQLVRENFH
jgi:ribosomal protein S18 acetylase RimI-like enzyme